MSKLTNEAATNKQNQVDTPIPLSNICNKNIICKENTPQFASVAKTVKLFFLYK
jgi:hypothetical protein